MNKTAKQAEKQAETAFTEASFTKDQLISAERFSDKKDALNALLSKERTYTAREAENIILSYLKGQVK